MSTITVTSEITGTVCRIEARVGQTIDADDTILLIESMKMEIPAQAPVAGVLTEIRVAEGDGVAEGDPIATIESA